MQQWGIGVSIFPPVCTGSQNPQNYFSNTYVLPSVNRTAGPKRTIIKNKMSTNGELLLRISSIFYQPINLFNFKDYFKGALSYFKLETNIDSI